MKYYIASGLENADVVKRISRVLQTAGHCHTYDWTGHGSVQSAGEDRIKEVARNEFIGVRSADVVIVVLPGGRGTHVELGMAIALDKDIIICAAPEDLYEQERICAFYLDQRVKICAGDINNWLVEILAYMNMKLN